MNLELFFLIIFISGCIFHSYTDYKYLLLYDEVSMSLLMVGIIRAFFYDNLLAAGLGFLITGGVLLLSYILLKEGLGFGDVKLGAVLGIWLGWQQGLFSILVALWLGLIGAIIEILLLQKKGRDAMAFGPYLCTGAIIMLYHGEKLLNWYQGLF